MNAQRGLIPVLYFLAFLAGLFCAAVATSRLTPLFSVRHPKIMDPRRSERSSVERYEEGEADVPKAEDAPDAAGTATIAPYERRLHSSYFHIRNPLGLFYPYRTSDDDMHITASMQAAWDSGVR